MSTVQGYGIEATLTDTELRAHGTNKFTHAALAGPNHPDDVVVALDQIARVEHSTPKMGGTINGHVVVHTQDGRKVEMHYRKKNTEFRQLAETLAAR